MPAGLAVIGYIYNLTEEIAIRPCFGTLSECVLSCTS